MRLAGRAAVDLEKFIKDSVSHPLFRGRTSLKVTLPVLVPAYQTRYAALAVNNGADAATAFERLASPDITPGACAHANASRFIFVLGRGHALPSRSSVLSLSCHVISQLN